MNSAAKYAEDNARLGLEAQGLYGRFVCEQYGI